MSLGSLTRWQSAAFAVVRLANTIACSQAEPPLSVIATTLIAALFFCQFEYTNGGVIATLAILETPGPVQTTDHHVDVSEVESKHPPVPTSDESEDAGQFLRMMRTPFLKDVIPSICGGLLSITFFYCLSLGGFMDMTYEKGIMRVVYVCVTASISGSLVAPRGSNAVTNQRGLARQYLQKQGYWSLFTGIDVFLVYMFLTAVILALLNFYSATATKLPTFMMYKLCAGLVLTNIHTAWIHTVISKPTGKSIWERIPGWRDWLRTLPVASLDILLPSCVYYFTDLLLASLREIPAANRVGELIPETLAPLGTIAFLPLPLVLEALVSVCTRGIYVKVAASMLPSDAEPVVPFDRDFGSQARDGGGYPSILDAARAIKLQNWHRYVRVLVETFTYEVPGLSLFIGLLAVELYFSPCTAVELIALFTS